MKVWLSQQVPMPMAWRRETVILLLLKKGLWGQCLGTTLLLCLELKDITQRRLGFRLTVGLVLSSGKGISSLIGRMTGVTVLLYWILYFYCTKPSGFLPSSFHKSQTIEVP